MKNISKLILVLTFALSLGATSALWADETAPATPAPNAPGACTHHHGNHAGHNGHHGNVANSPMFKAMHGAFAACKTAGVAPQACGQQLATYLADFKPAN